MAYSGRIDWAISPVLGFCRTTGLAQADRISKAANGKTADMRGRRIIKALG